MSVQGAIETCTQEQIKRGNPDAQMDCILSVNQFEISHFVMIAILSILSIAMIWLTYRVTSSVWAKEKIIPIVLFLLTLSVLLYLVESIFKIYILFNTDETYRFSFLYLIQHTYIFYNPQILLVLAIILNCERWLCFLIYICIQIQAEKNLDRQALQNDDPLRLPQNYNESLLASKKGNYDNYEHKS